jgi:hypothetical protein
MTVRGYLTSAEVAEQLELDENAAIQLIRRVGPRDTLRLNDGRLLVPAARLDELRKALQ